MRHVAVLAGLVVAGAASAADRPNVLWITFEDISTHLGCYGDDYAVTPHLDAFAEQGVRYTNAHAPIGVCAPARSCLITGMYPPAIGTQHMRCQGNPPPFARRGYPSYLREAGYYCTNNSKTDYNFNPPKEMWDESGNKAHWRNRPDKDQPFFAIFNFTQCHESQIRLPERAYQQRVANFTDEEKHDPDKAPIPPYHPDTPEVRQDWARYADMITYTDKLAGDVLKQLQDDGLADDTIVFFYSDHGAGMPRSKRWLYDSSTLVPMIIRFPEKWKKYAPGEPGSTSDRLVNFVDFGPTLLSLVGVKIPEHMQGKAFLGDQSAEPQQYVYGFRDRMDERYDMIRSVRDGQYKYIRNFHPELPWFHHQHISYMYEMPTMRVWQNLADQDKLEGPRTVFMAETKPTEELYDIQADPHEVKNLADSPEHQEVLKRMRAECRRWMKEVGDLGLLPEADLRTRFGDKPQYLAVREEPEKYPFDRIFDTADLANFRDPGSLPALVERLKDEDPAVRYWAATGIGAIGEAGEAALRALTEGLEDAAPIVRVAAADALCRLDRVDDALPTLTEALSDANEWVVLAAINVVDRLGEKAASARPAVEKAAERGSYVQRVAEHVLESSR